MMSLSCLSLFLWYSITAVYTSFFFFFFDTFLRVFLFTRTQVERITDAVAALKEVSDKVSAARDVPYLLYF